MNFEIFPVGILKKDKTTKIEIHEKFQDAMFGLKEGQRIMLLLYFHKSEDKRDILRVHSHGEPGFPLRGVFAARSPVRPNPIALYNVAIKHISGRVLEIEEIDAYDGTPVVDIKPFVKHYDCPEK